MASSVSAALSGAEQTDMTNTDKLFLLRKITLNDYKEESLFL